MLSNKSLWEGHWLGGTWGKLPRGWKCWFLFGWWLSGGINIWKHYWIVHLRFVHFMYNTLKTILLMCALGWYLLLKSLEEEWEIEQCQRAGQAGEEVRMEPVGVWVLTCTGLLPAPGAGSSYCSCVFLLILTLCPECPVVCEQQLSFVLGRIHQMMQKGSVLGREGGLS